MESTSGYSVVDPGWAEAIRRGITLTMAKASSPLVGLRSLHMMFASWIAVAVIVAVVLGVTGVLEESLDPALAAGLSALVGAMSFIGAMFVHPPLSCTSDAALAGSYRTQLIVRIAIAEVGALAGFVAVILSADPWTVLPGAFFTAVALFRIAPTADQIDREQQRLLDAGCARSLVAALRPPFPTGR